MAEYIKEVYFDTSDLRGYLNNIEILQKINEIEFKNNVTFIIGENGMGKSTIIEAIAVAYGLNPEGGSKNMFYSNIETHSDLYKKITINKGINKPSDAFFLRVESFYNLASNVDELNIHEYYGDKSLHTISHGESFLALIENRFFGKGLYILDEPESPLSPVSEFRLLRMIADLANNGSQFIIATHSPILIALEGAEILEINGGKLEAKEYKQTFLYNLYKRFLIDENYRKTIIG